jgi:hypothetical protein
MIDLSQSRITRSTKRGELAQTFINFPPMQKGASFNMEALRQQIEAAQGNFLSH